MIVGAAVCPHPPLLLRELTGAQDVGAGLRDQCRAAVRTVLERAPEVVVVVGGAEAGGTWPPGTVLDVHAYGPGAAERSPSQHQSPSLPLSLGIGARLLDDAGWAGARELRSVPWDLSPAECAALGRDLATPDLSAAGRRTALLVMGDGSARRSVKAPGYLDPRAVAFDATATRAVGTGDGAQLAALDPDLAAEVFAAGRAAWQVLAGAVPVAEAHLLHADDPFGVLYLVATWFPTVRTR